MKNSNKNHVKLAISAIFLSSTLPLAHATTSWTAASGNWTGATNWDNGVPGLPDNTFRQNNGGTINVTAPVSGSGSVNGRLNDSNNTSVNTLNWNPGAADSFTFTSLWTGNNVNNGAAVFNQQSGTITTTSADWYHIGRQGSATYTASGSAAMIAEGRLSIAQNSAGASDGGFLILNNTASFTDSNGNESFIGRGTDAKGTLTMNDSSTASLTNVRIGHESNAQGTIIMNDAAVATFPSGNLQIGRNGTAEGNFVMNGSSVANVNTPLQIADLNGQSATGNLTLNDNAIINVNRAGIAHDANELNSANIVMNHNSRMNANSWFELGGGQATFTMNNSSFLDSNGNFVIGMNDSTSAGGDGISRLILNDQARVDSNGGNFDIGNNNGSKGLVELNDNSSIIDSWIRVGRLGQGELVINDNASVTLSQWVAVGQDVNGSGANTVTVNGGSLTINDQINVGEKSAGSLDVTGGVVDIGNRLRLAAAHGGQVDSTASIVNQSGGDVVIGNYLHLEAEDSGGGEGTYNLTGGTLHVNDIRISTGDFNWAGGTLTHEEPNAGSSGIGGGGFGGVGAGTTLSVTGDLTTGAGGILDLGDLYINAGNTYDVLDVSGNLTLSGVGDTLDFWDNANLLRPGGNTTITGVQQLISVGGSLSGQFDNVIGPQTLGQFFQFYQTGPTGVPNGTSADTLRRNTGYLDYRADGVYFVYKIGGQIPEPQTTAFLFFGIALLRGMTVLKRNQGLRKNMSK